MQRQLGQSFSQTDNVTNIYSHRKGASMVIDGGLAVMVTAVKSEKDGKTETFK